MTVRKFLTNKNKCYFKCTRILFFGEIISNDRLQLGPRKLHALTEMLPPKKQKLTAINFRYNELPRTIPVFNYRGVSTTKMTHIIEM